MKENSLKKQKHFFSFTKKYKKKINLLKSKF